MAGLPDALDMVESLLAQAWLRIALALGKGR